MATSKSAHHELTRKDMKAPDKFQAAATEAAGWAATDGTAIAAARANATSRLPNLPNLTNRMAQLPHARVPLHRVRRSPHCTRVA